MPRPNPVSFIWMAHKRLGNGGWENSGGNQNGASEGGTRNSCEMMEKKRKKLFIERDEFIEVNFAGPRRMM